MSHDPWPDDEHSAPPSHAQLLESGKAGKQPRFKARQPVADDPSAAAGLDNDKSELIQALVDFCMTRRRAPCVHGVQLRIVGKDARGQGVELVVVEAAAGKGAFVGGLCIHRRPRVALSVRFRHVHKSEKREVRKDVLRQNVQLHGLQDAVAGKVQRGMFRLRACVAMSARCWSTQDDTHACSSRGVCAKSCRLRGPTTLSESFLWREKEVGVSRPAPGGGNLDVCDVFTHTKRRRGMPARAPSGMARRAQFCTSLGEAGPDDRRARG